MRTPTPVSRLLVILFVSSLAITLSAAKKDPWHGLRLEGTIPIDVGALPSDIVVELDPSPFQFEPVEVLRIDPDKPGKPVRIKMRFHVKNRTDEDYFIYSTATLIDPDGAAIATMHEKDKVEEDDTEGFGIKFKLPETDVGRVAACRLTFAFERD